MLAAEAGALKGEIAVYKEQKAAADKAACEANPEQCAIENAAARRNKAAEEKKNELSTDEKKKIKEIIDPALKAYANGDQEKLAKANQNQLDLLDAAQANTRDVKANATSSKEAIAKAEEVADIENKKFSYMSKYISADLDRREKALRQAEEEKRANDEKNFIITLPKKEEEKIVDGIITEINKQFEPKSTDTDEEKIKKQEGAFELLGDIRKTFRTEMKTLQGNF